jgi:hypothetical protein
VKARTNAATKAHLVRGAFLLVFFAGVLLALFAASALGRPREAKSPTLTRPINGVIGGNGTDGANCYTITSGTDTVVPGTTDTGNHCVWCETPITLPFPFVLYDQTFNTVNVSSSGRLDFVCQNDPANYLETCLPAPPHNCPFDYTIFPLWYEWGTLTYPSGCMTWANGCGIFTSISGTAPNRIFNIEWHAIDRQNSAQTGDFEVRLYENDPNKRFDVIYGSVTQGLDTGYDVAGVQGPTGFFTQNFCRTYPPQNVSRIYAIMTPCPTPTATATPTPTPTGSPTGGILWYNGDFNGVNALANEQNTSIGSGEFASVYDDFIVSTSGGWDVTAVFSDNLITTNMTGTVIGATWEIRQGISEGNGGTLIASGMTSAPSVTPTGRGTFNFNEYMVEVPGLAVHLPFSTTPYWLNVTPIGDLTGRFFDSNTSGANCVGTPCGNNQNAFFNSNFFGANFTSTANEGQPSDFSMGVLGSGSGGGTPTPTPTATVTAPPRSTPTPRLRPTPAPRP